MIPEIHRAAAPVVQRFALTLAAACLVLLLPAASFGETAPQKEKPSELRGEPIGANQALAIIPDLDEATRTADGLGVWTHSVSMEGAAFLRPRFADFDLRPGDSLIVRSASGRVVETLRGQGPKDRRSFWGLSAFGSELHLELRFRGVYRQAPFRITDVIVGDPAMLESVTAVPGAPAPPAQKSICAPADFEDVVCYDSDTPKWANIFASAGVATADTGAGALWCSGANVSPLNYVLTNHHCIGSQSECDNAEFIFKYYRTGCNDGSPTTQDWVSYRCDEMVAFSPWNNQCDSPIDELDFSLHSVMGDPATDFGFVTPDPTPLNNGEGIYIVQHPSGRPHEIAHGSGANVEIDTGGGALSVLRYYDTLDTEGGSSGSPVFRESDDLMVGLHHCGGCSTAGVGNRGMLMSDIYPIIESFLCQPMLSLSSGAAGDITEVSGNGDAV
ncbi:MAG: serine protease, partial [Acidobacteriota bacterium]